MFGFLKGYLDESSDWVWNKKYEIILRVKHLTVPGYILGVIITRIFYDNKINSNKFTKFLNKEL